MKKILTLCFLSSILIFPSCVSHHKYTSELSSRQRCENDNAMLRGSKTALEKQVAALQNDTTQLGILYRENGKAGSNTCTVKQSESEEVNMELTKKAQLLAVKEKQLQDRETRLKDIEYVVANKDKDIQTLYSKANDALLPYEGDNLEIEMKDGKVYITLQENLLFKSGDDKLSLKGREALTVLGDVLLKNPGIQIMIESHCDDVSINKNNKFNDNWELSAQRSLSIIRLFSKEQGIDQKRITASGKREFSTEDLSKEEQANNRRTEIILSPRMDEVYNAFTGR